MDLGNPRASSNQITTFLERGIRRNLENLVFFLMFLLLFTNTKLLVLYKCKSFR